MNCQDKPVLIPQNIIDKISEWQEKAKKFDHYTQGNYELVQKQDYDTWQRLRNKAKKWDELTTGFEIHESSDPIALRVMIKEYRDKAKKWDELKKILD